jgi:epoxyqueuosine reductase
MTLTPKYLREVAGTPDYVQKMKRAGRIDTDEFNCKEIRTDELADELTHYLTAKGYSAFSQSENNLVSAGLYNEQTLATPLPHKTIALLAGLGWIGKHNLLVTPEFGSAVSICTVLTDAPVKTELHSPASSLCGDCSICLDICSPGALKGRSWDISTQRDELLDADRCTTCLKCLALCPWTARYAKENIKRDV